MHLYMSGTWSRRLLFHQILNKEEKKEMRLYTALFPRNPERRKNLAAIINKVSGENNDMQIYTTRSYGNETLNGKTRKAFDHLLPQKFPEFKMKLLYSYSELRNKKDIASEIPAYCDGVFLDSGAFSVYNSGKTIDIDAFIEFIQQYGNLFDVIASLDVIGDWQGSKKNYKYMIKRAVNVLPCYHYGEPIKVLDWYASITDYIGLGGMVGINKYQRCHFLESVFKRYPDNTKVKFHGFGVNDFTLLDQFPFYSVDSAAIVMCAINRQLKTDKGVFYMGEQLYKDKGVQYNDSVREYVRQLSLKYLGGDYMKQLMSPDVSTCVCFLVLLMYRIMMSKQFSSNYTYEHSRTGFDLMEDEI